MAIQDFANAVGYRVADPRTITQPGTVVFVNDAVATTAQKQEWDASLAVGIVQNNGIVEAREFIAPTAQVLSTNTLYHYRFFPTKESIPTPHTVDELKRGWGGEFPFTSAKNELRAAELEQIGISMVLEKAMSEADPQYKGRAFDKLVTILETATLFSALDALNSIVTPIEWTPAGDWLDDVLAEQLLDASEKAGVAMNRMLFGVRSWMLRKASIGVEPNARNFNAPRKTSELGEELNVEIYIPKAHISADGSFPHVASDKIYGFNAKTGVSTEDVSNLKTFTGRGGLKMTTWEHPQGEMEIITVSRWQSIQATCPLGAFAITTSKA